jgi:hypothetical protein
VRYPISFTILILLLLASPAWGQNPAPPAATRDPSALSLLTQSVAAMNTANAPALSDLLAEGTCTQWNGMDESASFTYSLIRNTASHFELHLADSTPSWTINAGRGFSVDKKGQRHPMHIKNAAKGNWYIPAAYILEAIADPNVSVMSIKPDDQTSSSGNEDVVVLTPAALPGAALVKDYAAATSHTIHLDRSTHLVTQVDDRAFFSNDLNSSVPHSLHYSDYREESGWMMPHSVEEYFGQGRAHAFTFSQFTINSNLPLASFAVSQ